MPETYTFHSKTVAANREVNGKPALFVKCVVWDLDNTLWDGVISEQDENILPKANVVEVIKELDSRGILNSIASKNEFDLIRQRLEDVGLWEYFLLPQIHWGAKSESIRKLTEQLGIGVDSIAFIDDDPREREEVKSVFGGVRTYAPDQIGSLLQKPEFMVPSSDESAARAQMYRTEFKRQEFRDLSGLSNEKFLEQLDLVMTVREGVNPRGGERMIELLQRANNWHLTGHKNWSSRSLVAYANKDDCVVLSFDLKDKFGGYGCIGVALLMMDRSSATMRVEELVMSCRAAAKTTDIAIVREIARFTVRHGLSRIVFRLFKTDRNIPLQRFLNSICVGHIVNHEDGFAATISDVLTFLHSKQPCFVKTTDFQQ